MMDGVTKNKEYYEKAYKSGYGVMYPESHVIRWYERILKYELKIDGAKGGKLFDFGCGNGTHAIFFRDKGFKVYGADIDKKSVDIARERMPDIGGNFHVIGPDDDVTKLFDFKFDIIFSNQVLYFIDNERMAELLRMFDKMLAEDGIVFFTMIGPKHYLNSLITEKLDNGLSRAELKGRLGGVVYVNVTGSEEELKERFSIFEPIYTGYYDFCLMKGDSRHHLSFTGRKRKP